MRRPAETFRRDLVIPAHQRHSGAVRQQQRAFARGTVDAAVAPEIVHVDDDEVLSGLQQFRRQFVEALRVAVGIAHRAAIHPGDIDVIDEPQRKFRGLRRLALVERDTCAEPHHAVVAAELGHIPVFPVAKIRGCHGPAGLLRLRRPRLRAAGRGPLLIPPLLPDLAPVRKRHRRVDGRQPPVRRGAHDPGGGVGHTGR